MSLPKLKLSEEPLRVGSSARHPVSGLSAPSSESVHTFAETKAPHARLNLSDGRFRAHEQTVEPMYGADDWPSVTSRA